MAMAQPGEQGGNMAVLADGKTFAYELGQTIGVGATGKVKLGVHRETGQRVAVKIVSAR